MIISGIRANAGFYNYNSIKTEETAAVSAVTGQEPKQAEQQTQPAISASSEQPRQNLTAYDYALQYDSEASYEMKGADSDLESLDVAAAISQMHKDQMLQQYQFFVGNQGVVAKEAENFSGNRPMENFIL